MGGEVKIGCQPGILGVGLSVNTTVPVGANPGTPVICIVAMIGALGSATGLAGSVCSNVVTLILSEQAGAVVRKGSKVTDWFGRSLLSVIRSPVPGPAPL